MMSVMMGAEQRPASPLGAVAATASRQALTSGLDREPESCLPAGEQDTCTCCVHC